jgi:putative FmdB family regulatory protein
MPIYAYKCESCGHAKDVLQKMSDAPLSVCPECGAATFKKQLTAAGFQLKGSGWYVTDFRGGDNGSKPAKPGDGDSSTPAAPGADSKPADSKPAESGTSAAPVTAPVTSKPVPVAAAPAASSGSSKTP